MSLDPTTRALRVHAAGAEGHSPLPWHTGEKSKFAVYTPERKCVAVCDTTYSDREDLANAALIVESVNSRPALLGLLEKAREENAELRGHLSHQIGLADQAWQKFNESYVAEIEGNLEAAEDRIKALERKIKDIQRDGEQLASECSEAELSAVARRLRSLLTRLTEAGIHGGDHAG